MLVNQVKRGLVFFCSSPADFNITCYKIRVVECNFICSSLMSDVCIYFRSSITYYFQRVYVRSWSLKGKPCSLSLSLLEDYFVCQSITHLNYVNIFYRGWDQWCIEILPTLSDYLILDNDVFKSLRSANTFPFVFVPSWFIICPCHLFTIIKVTFGLLCLVFFLKYLFSIIHQ